MHGFGESCERGWNLFPFYAFKANLPLLASTKRHTLALRVGLFKRDTKRDSFKQFKHLVLVQCTESTKEISSNVCILVVIISIGLKKVLFIYFTNKFKKTTLSIQLINLSYFRKLLQSDNVVGACDYSQVTSFVCSVHQTISESVGVCRRRLRLQ